MTFAPSRAHTGGATKLGENYLDRGRRIIRMIVRIDANVVVRIRSRLVRVLTTLGGL